MKPEVRTTTQNEELWATLKARHEANMHRHEGIPWDEVLSRLGGQPAKLWSLGEMERTGGEPDLVGVDEATGEFLYYDCSAESPKGRRSLCYDPQALEARKKHRPSGSAMGMAAELAATLLTKAEYRRLQDLGKFDTKTSSWLQTPEEIRRLGGAIFGDFRYETVFIYHNSAESYYSARGFRCVLRV